MFRRARAGARVNSGAKACEHVARFGFANRRGVALLAAAFAAGLALACGGGADEQPEAAGEAPAAAAPAMEVANAGMITGKVNFQGTAPQAKRIDMSEEPTCADKHAQGAFTEEVVANPNGTLRHVFVYVKQGLPDQAFPVPAEGVTIDQNGCLYQPHVLGLQANQNLIIKNSDGLLHNINAKPTENRGFNISQPTTMESKRSFRTPEVMIPVECDVHGWMKAYIGVLSHPYFAVSGGDGSFTIKNLPPGDYVLEAWHERYGTQTMNVTVGPQETKDVQFTYNAGMAENAVVPLGRPLELHDHAGGHTAHGGAGS
ncbi:MAG: carboxypeptidase regulatory-like domain-containing protein [Gemmatimonadetes bacterium]|nr:carboxypeptidase regulatory-like domain-containing protein [Gemmatimonadota bacterium]